MSKLKILYTCQACAAQFPKWMGQCSDCEAWNSLVEENNATTGSSNRQGYSGLRDGQIQKLSDIIIQDDDERIKTSLSELDHVLGGGLVPGSVILIGGDPGIGKSTILLQTLCHLSKNYKALYVTGEESLKQVTLRAQRLHLQQNQLLLLCETRVETILAAANSELPKVMVIDSIQTIFTEEVSSAPGSVSQIRESAAKLVQFAKATGTTMFLIGHVTKEGLLAGPRVLEHMVDTVLYFEGEAGSRFRVIRAVKNRFGAVNELGVFAMTEDGLREVNNPSAIFLSQYNHQVAGSTVMVTWEGSRPLLVEVQALVDESHLSNPRRVIVGLEQNRLSMLLAVLHRHGGIVTYDQDVFVNVVGGVRVTETGSDLALLMAVLSSLRNKPFDSRLIVFGEVGLAGEIRPVPNGQERLREAQKHGFNCAVIPKANAPKTNSMDGLDIVAVSKLSEALAVL